MSNASVIFPTFQVNLGFFCGKKPESGIQKLGTVKIERPWLENRVLLITGLPITGLLKYWIFKCSEKLTLEFHIWQQVLWILTCEPKSSWFRVVGYSDKRLMTAWSSLLPGLAIATQTTQCTVCTAQLVSLTHSLSLSTTSTEPSSLCPESYLRLYHTIQKPGEYIVKPW